MNRGGSLRVGGAVLAAFWLASAAGAGDLNKKHNYVVKLNQGVYYPGPYYSRSYLQDYPLGPGDRPLFFRLHPFQHYGRYRQGDPIEPGLTDGGLQLRLFPYRYRWDFEPVRAPRPIYLSPCDDPRARRWEDLTSRAE